MPRNDDWCKGLWINGDACGECGVCIGALLILISDLTDTEGCYYSGEWCVTHDMQKPCSHETAKKVIETWGLIVNKSD